MTSIKKQVARKPRVDIQLWIVKYIANYRTIVWKSSSSLARQIGCSVSGVTYAFVVLQERGIIVSISSGPDTYGPGPNFPKKEEGLGGAPFSAEAPPEPPMGPTVEELMKVIFSLNQILEMSLRGLQISYDEMTALQNRLNGEIRHRIDLQFFKDENVEYHRHKDQIDNITDRQENSKKLIEWWMRENASIGQSVRIENM